MDKKKATPQQSSPNNSPRYSTTAACLIAAVTAWACAMCYLQDDNTPQRQPSAPVVTLQEVRYD